MAPGSPPSRRAFLRGTAVAAGSSLGLPGCLASGPSPEDQVANHRDELATFEDVVATIAAGYQTTGRFVQTDAGVLGEPFINRRVEDLDETRPNVVLCDLGDDGRYEPLGLLWYVPAEDRSEPPQLFGRTFDGPVEGHLPAVPEHYVLTVWLYRDNPEGLFARYHSAVEPSSLVGAIAPVRDALRSYLVGGQAEEAGYRNTEQCIEGGYGVPFVHPESSSGTDETEPPLLLYRLTSNWNYLLMGAEWSVPADDVDGPPSMFGRSFHEARDGHSPKVDQPRHYGLHAWLFYANPDGMFETTNPVVEC